MMGVKTVVSVEMENRNLQEKKNWFYAQLSVLIVIDSRTRQLLYTTVTVRSVLWFTCCILLSQPKISINTYYSALFNQLINHVH